MIPGLTRPDIARIHEVIRPYIRRTPVLHASGSDVGLGPFPLTFKLEFVQHAGSFKARGAFTNLLTRQIPPAGVVAASGGNHGIAVAHAAQRLGIPATIFVPTVSSPVKVEAIRACHAEVVVTGDRYADALAASEAFAADSQALQIHAFDQLETLLGQGTVARELSEQAPDAATVLVAVGGGGLVGGIAAWYADTGVRVIGIEPVAAPTLTEALKAGRPVDAPAGGIAADSLAPRRVGELMFPIAQQHIERVLLVEDEEIVRAQNRLWESFRLFVEPGGAAAFAALLAGRYEPAPDEHVAVVLCGGNAQRK
ncbi:MAG TPA: threonine/serine dehydratase [Vicinamibacterales bacterium]|nr:threonine/serine dehydratase [Vicinamibacterales bacterium]